MKRFRPTYIYIVFLISSSCSGNIGVNISKLGQDSTSREQLRIFAEEYLPRTTPNLGPDKLPEISQELRGLIYTLDEVEKSNNEKYIVLIVLKLYHSHLECCNQSYELRVGGQLDSLRTPILYAFLQYTGQYDLGKAIKFIPSSISYDWVKQNSVLSDFRPIAKEIGRIKKRIKKIESGDF